MLKNNNIEEWFDVSEKHPDDGELVKIQLGNGEDTAYAFYYKEEKALGCNWIIEFIDPLEALLKYPFRQVIKKWKYMNDHDRELFVNSVFNETKEDIPDFFEGIEE